ncbi:MAG: hypothetical protein EA413_00500 [Cyanobium sp. PLM2.Bin73]|nr:MAG: hypothetical protein EA413_00500 [Cyanobium sp. PLM2.Bin73]
MALWLCCLDCEDTTSASGPDPRACGVRGWLLEADVSPDGPVAPANWELVQRCGAGLPFGLDCRLVAPFTPAQETRAAAELAPWLVRDGSLRLQGRPVLLLRGAEQFSHRRFGPKGLRLALNSALRRLGCALPVLLACWQNDPVHDADAVIDWAAGKGEQPAPRPLNYEGYLLDAHHRPCPTGPWRIPAVMAPADPRNSPFLNASAELYNEWLELESSWSEFWLQGSAEAPVVLASWAGHQRWWRAPQPLTPPLETIRIPSAAPQAPEPLETSWGTMQAHHLALLVHGFHLPVLRRILSRLPAGGGSDGLPSLDLYLTVPEDRYEASIGLLQQLSWPRLQLFGVANRGRDLAPFLLRALPSALANGHQQFVKVHTKASSHLGDGKRWADHLLDSLVSTSFLQQLAGLLENNPDVGLIAPSGTVLPCTVSLGKNAGHLLHLCQLYGIQPRSLLASQFIAGTMMAGRLEALRPLLQVPLNLEAFEAEAGQTDGTLAHALERWIAVMAQAQGWQIQELEGFTDAVPRFGYGWATDPSPS